MRTLKPLLLLAFMAILAGCSTVPGAKVCPAPTIVQVPVPTYVPIDPELTKPLPIAMGGLAECPAVARERRRALEQANIDRATVGKIQGKPVPNEETP